MTDTHIAQTKHDAIMDHDVIVFSKDRCPQCDQTKRVTRKNGIDFHEVDLQDESIRLTDQEYETPYEFVTQALKAKGAPVVIVKNHRLDQAIKASVYGDFTFWFGFRSDFIKAIAPDNQD